MKRFTETTKWGDPWYQDLPNEYKLLWVYLCDCCDACGVWKVNVKLASFQLNIEFDSQKVLELFGKRIHVLSPEKWFIPSFIKFQYGELSDECRPHKPILELIRTHKLDRVLKDYQSPIDRAKDKEKEQDKDKKGECEGIFPDRLNTPEFREIWIHWAKHRKQIKKPLTPEMESASLKKLSQYGPARAIEIVEHTLVKGWQGLADESVVPVTIKKIQKPAEKAPEWQSILSEIVSLLTQYPLDYEELRRLGGQLPDKAWGAFTGQEYNKMRQIMKEQEAA